MKKVLIAFILFLVILGSFPMKGIGQDQGDQEQFSEFQVIPDEAIRLRILANSDSEKDQQLKRTIRDEVNKEITKWVEKIDDINEARQLIEARLVDIDAIVDKVLTEQNVDQTYTVDYDKDVKFPTKVYGDYVYPAGTYEAILISLGEAKGANWWCVLFPPLCFLDFSNGSSVAEEGEEEKQEEQDEEDEEVEVKFFFMKWFG